METSQLPLELLEIFLKVVDEEGGVELQGAASGGDVELQAAASEAAPTPVQLAFEDVCVEVQTAKREAKLILDGVSGHCSPGELLAVMGPSGAGKTVFALRVTEALGSQLTLVLVPSIELVSQTYREWERWREQGALDGWRPLAVVSSSSVPTLPMTTKVDEIVSYLRSSQDRPQGSVVRSGRGLRRAGRAHRTV